MAIAPADLKCPADPEKNISTCNFDYKSRFDFICKGRLSDALSGFVFLQTVQCCPVHQGSAHVFMIIWFDFQAYAGS